MPTSQLSEPLHRAHSGTTLATMAAETTRTNLGGVFAHDNVQGDAPEVGRLVDPCTPLAVHARKMRRLTKTTPRYV